MSRGIFIFLCYTRKREDYFNLEDEMMEYKIENGWKKIKNLTEIFKFSEGYKKFLLSAAEYQDQSVW